MSMRKWPHLYYFLICKCLKTPLHFRIQFGLKLSSMDPLKNLEQIQICLSHREFGLMTHLEAKWEPNAIHSNYAVVVTNRTFSVESQRHISAVCNKQLRATHLTLFCKLQITRMVLTRESRKRKEKEVLSLSTFCPSQQTANKIPFNRCQTKSST